MQEYDNDRCGERMREIFSLLSRLGARVGSCAFFYTAYTVYLAMENPERLILVTKWLYPETAKQYQTNWRAVERSIRCVICTVWLTNPMLLQKIAANQMNSRPTPTAFIAVLAGYLTSHEHEAEPL